MEAARGILKLFAEDFEEMAGSLTIMNQRLVLLHPVSKADQAEI